MKDKRSVWRSVAEYAIHAGVTPVTANAWIKSGKIPFSAVRKLVGKNREIHRARADKARRDGVMPVSTAKKAKTDAQKLNVIQQADLALVSLEEAKTVKANYESALKKLEYDEKREALVPKFAIEKQAFDIARGVRDALLNIPDRISAELASMTDTHKINDKMKVEITQALEELSL